MRVFAVTGVSALLAYLPGNLPVWRIFARRWAIATKIARGADSKASSDSSSLCCGCATFDRWWIMNTWRLWMSGAPLKVPTKVLPPWAKGMGQSILPALIHLFKQTKTICQLFRFTRF